MAGRGASPGSHAIVVAREGRLPLDRERLKRAAAKGHPVAVPRGDLALCVQVVASLPRGAVRILPLGPRVCADFCGQVLRPFVEFFSIPPQRAPAAAAAAAATTRSWSFWRAHLLNGAEGEGGGGRRRLVNEPHCRRVHRQRGSCLYERARVTPLQWGTAEREGRCAHRPSRPACLPCRWRSVCDPGCSRDPSRGSRLDLWRGAGLDSSVCVCVRATRRES